ncbi:MAG: PHP domain-containing protein [Clostridia bacterium]
MLSIHHDLHCHTRLSSCCEDPTMTPEAIVRHAVSAGYDTVCITDHLWDRRVAGASAWYAPQDIAHICQNLPLPQADGLRVLFGCETEYCGHGKLGLAKESFERFDLILIPPNHMHMGAFTRPPQVDTEEKMAELFMERLEEIASLALPWRKVGIAHLTCPLLFSEGSVVKVLEHMNTERLCKVFALWAAERAGIELNAHAFGEYAEAPDAYCRFYGLAKEAGCRFYYGSDAHAVHDLDCAVPEAFVQALKLTEQDRFMPVS